MSGDDAVNVLHFLIIGVPLVLTACSNEIIQEQERTTYGNQQDINGETITKETLNALNSGFQSPVGIAYDDEGNLYVANWGGNNVIKIDTNGHRSTFVDGIGSPAGLDFDNSGNLYIADYSEDVLYKVSPDKEKTVFAEGLHTPTGISFDDKGNLLVANRSSDEIVSISSDGEITQLAYGLQTPVGVAQDSNGNIYVSNYSGGISRITPQGKVEIVTTDFSTPGVGITINKEDTVFVVDYGDGSVKQIDKSGKVVQIARNLNNPVGLLFSNGKLLVSTWGDGSIYELAIK